MEVKEKSRVPDDWRNFYSNDAYVSSSSLARRIKDTSYPGRCGKVKRAPTLSELEEDDVDYYLTDDVYYEERK